MIAFKGHRRAFLFMSAAVLACAQTPLASAQITVIDPTNLAQNILQAARAIEQINNQIRQIEQQAQMLARSPLQLSPELSRSIENARAVFDAASQVSFEAGKVGDSLRELYPDTFRDFDLESVLSQSDQWMSESRVSLTRAMEAEARAAASVAGSRNAVDTALTASAGAEGQTSAAQAGNQLLGVIAAQLAETQAMLAAQGRALETERMERLAREQRAAEIMRRAFPTRGRDVAPARSAF
jgi:P-type conjugative transfer protein TrbJ